MPELNPYEAPQTISPRQGSARDTSPPSSLQQFSQVILLGFCVQFMAAVLTPGAMNYVFGAKHNTSLWGGLFFFLVLLGGVLSVGVNLLLARKFRSWSLFLAQLLALGLYVAYFCFEA